MNGKYLVKLTQSLTHAEWDQVQQALRVDEEGIDYFKLVAEIHAAGKFDRKRLSRLLGVSETTVSRIVPKACQTIIQGLGVWQADRELALDIALHSAWKLVFRMEDETAAVLMQDLYAKAEAIERYDILFQCQRLIEVATRTIAVEGLSKEELTRKQSNIWQYRELFSKAKNLKTASVVRKQVLIQELENSPLLQSASMALSVTARAAYWGIQTRLCFFQHDLNGARGNQLKLIDLLETHRWLSRYHDFFLAREYRSLIPMLIEDNQTELANAMLMTAANLGQDSKLGKQNNWQQLYPTRLIMQMRNGNITVADEIKDDILRLIEREKEHLPATFVNQNLYYIAYYLFSKGDFLASKRTLLRTIRKSKEKDFLPFNWSMVRILNAVLAFELGDEQDLRDEAKNIRQTNFYQESPYYKLVLRCLVGIYGVQSVIDLDVRINKYQEEVRAVRQDSGHHILISYFDISAWLESKRHKCPMIAVISGNIGNSHQFNSGRSSDVSS